MWIVPYLLLLWYREVFVKRLRELEFRGTRKKNKLKVNGIPALFPHSKPKQKKEISLNAAKLVPRNRYLC